VPVYLDQQPALARFSDKMMVLLHGSTTRGIDDPYSDLDVWIILPLAQVRKVEAVAGTRFFPFNLENKPGHFTVEPVEEVRRRCRQCDFPFIAELRMAEILADWRDEAAILVLRARDPMHEDVRRAWFRYHYIEMRGEHRAADNSIERGDAVAVLQAMTQTLSHALRAAMVLDGEPYPYVKWLAHAAFQTPTGRLIEPHVTEFLDWLARDALRLPGPEKQHPLSSKLREIRLLLVEAAQASGIDELWLDEWWFYIVQARDGIREIVW
jgi:predicted nucleotidyltransferase